MFKNPFSFNGRIRRLEFGLSAGIYCFMIFPISLLLNSTDSPENPFVLLMMIGILLAMLWFMIAQGAKRCHDIGSSGMWQIVPFYNFLLLFQNSDPGDNKYGPNPKTGPEIQGLEAV